MHTTTGHSSRSAARRASAWKVRAGDAETGSERRPRPTESSWASQSPAEPENGFDSAKSHTMGRAWRVNAGCIPPLLELLGGSERLWVE